MTMGYENHLNGHAYHMTHIDNLPYIFKSRAILSKNGVTEEDLIVHSIAYESVQGLRDRIFILDSIQQKYRNLHTYVPFYFSKYSPMLYVQQNRDILDDIVFFVINRSILKNQRVLFTDGNASMQKLSQDSGERVGIIPATGNNTCQREYRPNGPHGMNQICSNIYSDVAFLENLNWDVINNTRRIESFEEAKRIRSAEVLIPDKISLNEIQYIGVRTEKTARMVKTIVEECGLTNSAPPININASLFLR